MSRRAATFIQADLNRVGAYAMKIGLKAMIIELPSGARIILPLDKDFSVDLDNSLTKLKLDNKADELDDNWTC